MTTKNRLALILALSLVTLSLTPTAVAREDRESYATGADVVTSCSEDLVGGLLASNYGSVCFDIQDRESSVDVTVDDFYLQGVGAGIKFLDTDGEQIGDDFVNFCGSIDGVEIPEDATSMEIYVNGPLNQLRFCQSVTASTTGEVIATFSE